MNWHEALWAALLALIAFVVSHIVVVILLLKVPEDCLLDRPKAALSPDRHPAVRWAILIAKNVLGMVLIVVGIVMGLPGVPGPGLVCVLLGVLLVSLPGKHRLARALLRHPAVLGTINRWRS